jgi:hypothetical protein
MFTRSSFIYPPSSLEENAPLYPQGLLGRSAAAKARGVKLGGPKLPQARTRAVAIIKAEAAQRAANLLPIIRNVQRAGASSLRDIAAALTSRGVSTPRGGQSLHQFATCWRGLTRQTSQARAANGHLAVV